jgi:hypothetical protein
VHRYPLKYFFSALQSFISSMSKSVARHPFKDFERRLFILDRKHEQLHKEQGITAFYYLQAMILTNDNLQPDLAAARPDLSRTT